MPKTTLPAFSTEPNWKNRTLFHRDNLDVLRGMNSHSVDLIATDPPFNKNKDFHATPDSIAQGAKFQDRWSWEHDVHSEWVDQLNDDYRKLMQSIESARHAHSDSMGAYLCFMAVRLIEMRRILKPTGCIYLHCDPTASHYLKTIMDAIFGWKNFVSNVVWPRYAPHSLAKSGMDTITDHILLYAKDLAHFRGRLITEALPERELKSKLKKQFPFQEEETGRWYNHAALEKSANAKTAGEVRLIQGKEVTSGIGWIWTQKTFDERLEKNPYLIYWTGSGRPRYKLYRDEYAGRPMGNLWTDIPYLSSNDSERIGYPTQKPLALYERIVWASSNPGDVVLDPFCGCATTCVAAEKLERQWVGIDIWKEAHEIVIERITKECNLTGPDGDTGGRLFTVGDLNYTTGVPERTDDGLDAVAYLATVWKKKRQQEVPDGFMSNVERRAHLVKEHGPRCFGCYWQAHDERHLELDHNWQGRKEGPIT